MTRQQRQPDKRRKKTTKKTGLLTAGVQAAGRTISRHPSLAGGGAAFFVVFSFVAANALWYQPGSHPAPLMTTRTDYTPRPSLPPEPQLADDLSAPREIAEGEGALQTIEDILLPVPTHRVKSISIRESDATSTASIPASPEEDDERASTPAAEPTRQAPQQATRDIPGDTLTRDLQRELARLGLYDGVIDGLAGPKTSAALAAYGKRTGLDGRPDPSRELLARMKLGQVAEIARPQARPPQASSGSSGNGGPAAPEQATVQNASAETRYVPLVDVPVADGFPAPAERVMKIQQGLVNIAYSDVSVDGVMGRQTREAIRDFQSHYRLPETGEPSEEVLEKLQEIGAL